jgi:hypothetical protein
MGIPKTAALVQAFGGEMTGKLSAVAILHAIASPRAPLISSDGQASTPAS